MIDLAIVGLGRWGLTLVESVHNKSDKVRFTQVVTRSPDRVSAVADRLDLTLLPDLAAALGNPRINGIVLAAPHSLHAQQIVACARARKPVFVEKPFTLTFADAKQAIAAASEAEIVCAAGHNRRFLPAMLDLAAVVSDGRLGRILFVESNFSGNVAGKYTPDLWRVAPGESPAGGMAGAGIHMLDAIVQLLGPIVQVAAYSSRQVLDVPMDDTTTAILVSQSGAAASLVTLMATTPDFRLKIFGTTGSAELRDPETMVLTSADGDRATRPFRRSIRCGRNSRPMRMPSPDRLTTRCHSTKSSGASPHSKASAGRSPRAGL